MDVRLSPIGSIDVGDRKVHLHLLVVLRHTSSLGFLLQSVVHFLPPSLFPFLDSLQEFFVPFTDQDLFDAMESDPTSYDTEELVDMIEQLILSGNVPRFDVALFTIPDDASLLLFAVSSTSFGSITGFSSCFLFSLSLKIDPIPR